jgi:D-tyrosyl-tRNA(Tyr) deacylase
MRAVIQRVSRARVEVEGETVSEIGPGLLIFLSVSKDDSETQAQAMAKKIDGLRIFDDEDGRMNRPIDSVDGSFLVVSQFTLYGDLTKGKRPSFDPAMRPPGSERLYELFCEQLEALSSRPVRRGRFGAAMKVELVNDGPATFLLEL